MSELVEFLRARLDEDERVATVLGDDMRQSWAIPEDESVAVIHMHRHAPARVLAEVDAKRRLLDLHSAEEGQHPDFCWHDKHELPCPTLRLLALPYAGRPDYRPEWRPS